MIKVEGSSNIAAIGYSKEERMLFVQFKSGPTYRYLDVPESEYLNLLHSQHVGDYFNHHIKHSYRYVR